MCFDMGDFIYYGGLDELTCVDQIYLQMTLHPLKTRSLALSTPLVGSVASFLVEAGSLNEINLKPNCYSQENIDQN